MSFEPFEIDLDAFSEIDSDRIGRNMTGRECAVCVKCTFSQQHTLATAQVSAFRAAMAHPLDLIRAFEDSFRE